MSLNITSASTSSRVEGKPRQALIFVGGGVLLLFTWLILCAWILAATESWLAPWDIVPLSQRPPVGDWQRALNDYFENRPGAVLPAYVTLATSVLLFLVRLARDHDRASLPLEFATLNLLFVVADIGLVILVWLPDLWLARPRSSLDVGYKRTWPAVVITTVLLLVLLRAQATAWLTKRLRMSVTARVLLVVGLLMLVFMLSALTCLEA